MEHWLDFIVYPKGRDIYNSSNYYREIKDIRYSVNEVSNIWTQMNHAVENLYRKFNNSVIKPN